MARRWRPLRGGRVRGLAVAAVATAALGVTATAASAGVMTYGTCRDASQRTSTSGWRAISLGSPPAGTSLGTTVDTCVSADGVLAARIGDDLTTAGAVGVGWTFTAPAGTSISKVDLSMYSYSAWSGPSAYLVRGWHDGDQSASGVVWGPIPTPEEAHRFQGQFIRDNLDWRSVTFSVQCSNVFNPTCNPHPWVQWMLYGGRIDLEDPSAPTISSVSGSLPVSGATTGTKTVSYNATDQGVGLYRTLVLVDGQLTQTKTIDENGGKCVALVDGQYRFGWHVPCKLSASDTVTVNTAAFRDGTHTVRVVAVDAAGNSTVVADRGLVTENKPLSTAAPQVTLSNKPSVQAGATLTTTRGSWDRSPASYEIEWVRCAADGSSCVKITDSPDPDDRYVVRAVDAYHRIKSRVRATNAGGTSAWVDSALSDVVVDEEGFTDPKPEVTAAVAWAAGSNASAPRPAEVLTIDPGKWVGKRLTYTYRFKRCAANGSCTTLAEGASKTYSVSASDVGATIVGEVTGSNAFGSRTAQTAATGTVLPVERDAGGGPTQKPPVGGGDNPPLPDIVPPNTGGGTQVVAIPNGSCEGSAARLQARFANKKTTATVAYGSGSKLAITLTCLRTGKPITGAELVVASTTAVGTKAAARVARTDAKGVTTLKLPKGVSRSIAIGWRTDSLAQTYAAQTTARLLVRSKITMRASSARVQPGGTVTLSGSVAGAPKGIVLNVQARDGKRWRTFDQVKTGNRGTYKYAYRFKRSRTGAAFSFRIATVAGQKKLATQTGASKPKVVRIAR